MVTSTIHLPHKIDVLVPLQYTIFFTCQMIKLPSLNSNCLNLLVLGSDDKVNHLLGISLVGQSSSTAA